MLCSKTNKTNYVLCSGWWCSGQSKDTRAELIGDDVIRGEDFHKLWYKSVDTFTNPDKILIVDSASPVKPPVNRDDPRLELISLDINAGHSTNHTGKYCGYTRAILIGLNYALQCDSDYFVYVEQDALLYGPGIVEYCIENMTKPAMYGSGSSTPGRLQQSFFIMHRSWIHLFLQKIYSIPYVDNKLSPENKFHIATSRGFSSVHAYLTKNAASNRLCHWIDWQLQKYARNWQDLPIGYGRMRPLDMNQPYFYFQHGGKEEIDAYLNLTGFEWPVEKKPRVNSSEFDNFFSKHTT